MGSVTVGGDGIAVSGSHKSGAWLHADLGIGSHFLGILASSEQLRGT